MTRIGKIVSADVERAHKWYTKRVQKIPHLMPRGIKEYRNFASKQQLIVAKDTNDNIVGVVYYCPHGKSWEVGGLVVEKAIRNARIGESLTRYALINLIFDGHGGSIICHVHSKNSKPLPLLKQLKFELTGSVELDGHEHPDMEPDSDGKIRGNIYTMNVKAGAKVLANWCRKMDKNNKSITLELNENETLKLWARELDKY